MLASTSKQTSFADDGFAHSEESTTTGSFLNGNLTDGSRSSQSEEFFSSRTPLSFCGNTRDRRRNTCLDARLFLDQCLAEGKYRHQSSLLYHNHYISDHNDAWNVLLDVITKNQRNSLEYLIVSSKKIEK